MSQQNPEERGPRADVVVRPARPEDDATIRKLVVALADFERLDPPDEVALSRLLADAFRPNPRVEIFLAEVEGQAAGYAFVFETYSTFLALPTLYLEDLFVLSEYRARGVGAAIMKYLAGEAQRRGCGRLDWVVLDWNENAIRFYERLGAERHGDWILYRLDAAGIDALAGEANKV